MCLDRCYEVVRENLSRRRFLAACGLAGIAASQATEVLGQDRTAEASQLLGDVTLDIGTVNRVVDLTHSLTPAFPTYTGESRFKVTKVADREKDGFYANRWSVSEHVGTHIDAPIHFSADGISLEQLPLESLVCPLAVIDLRAKAKESPDVRLRKTDLERWENAHGRIPTGACVAMNSGWSGNIGTPRFRNEDDQGRLHFPGFHEDAVAFLLEERTISGIAVDTMSLDYGLSATFPVHTMLLPRNKWGVECIANLSHAPPSGGWLLVGAPKVESASGGIARLLALA